MARVEERRREVERLAPPIQVALLDEISIKLDRLHEAQTAVLETLKSQTPRGITFEREGTVTFAEPWKCGFINGKPFHAVHRVNIINKGPDEVHAIVEIKDEETPYEITVQDREDIPVDVKRSAIKRIFFRVDKDKTADIKVIGLY